MRRTKILAVCIATGLAVLIAVQAAFFFLVPHDKNFAPEIGPAGAFMVFTAFFAVAYVASALVFEFAIRDRLESSSRSRKVILGGVLLLFIAVIVCAILMASAEIFTMFGVFALPALAYTFVRSGAWAT
jgi:membrane protease YdiL (CAAX protease family)